MVFVYISYLREIYRSLPWKHLAPLDHRIWALEKYPECHLRVLVHRQCYRWEVQAYLVRRIRDREEARSCYPIDGFHFKWVAIFEQHTSWYIRLLFVFQKNWSFVWKMNEKIFLKTNLRFGYLALDYPSVNPYKKIFFCKKTDPLCKK